MSSENAGCLATGLQVIGSAPTLDTDGSVLTPGNRSVQNQPAENVDERVAQTARELQAADATQAGVADPNKVSNKINTLVKDLGLDQTCSTEAINKMTNELTATDSFAVAGGLWGVAGGGLSTEVARNNIDRHMRSKGCEPVMVKVRNVLNTQKNISCNILNRTSTEVLEVNSNQTIVFTIDGNAKDSDQMLSDIAASKDRQLTNESDNRARLDQSQLPVEIVSKLIEASSAATRALNVPGWGLPQIDIDGFSASNTFTGTIVKISQIDLTTDTELKNSMIQGAQMEAESKLKESLGVDALPEGVKSISDEKINNYFETNSATMSNEANASKVEWANEQTISVNFNGNVTLNNFNLSNTSEIDMKIETLVGMSSKVAKDISGEMINLLSSKADFETEAAGLNYEAIIAEMGANNTALRAKNANLSENVMGGLAGLVPPFGLLMLIPLMIPLAGLFFFKSAVSTFLSPTVIKILMVVLVLFIIWVIVGKFIIGGKSETRRFPSSTHEMKKYNSHLLDRHRQAHTKLRRAGDGVLTRDEFSKGIAILTSDSARAASERIDVARRLAAAERAMTEQRHLQREQLEAQRTEVAQAIDILRAEVDMVRVAVELTPEARKRRSSNNVSGGPEMRRYEPEKMNVSDVSNNLGYVVTSTKGKKRTQPYQNVTFAPQGDWTIKSN